MANSKIITYDLCSPGRNYDDLYEKIKSYGTWAHICESTWIISTTDSCSDNDRLFVAALTGGAAWSNVLCKSNWLKENL